MALTLNEPISGIFTFSIPTDRGYPFFGTFVKETGLVIDPVQLVPEVVASGVKTIVLTNRNHFRAAAELKAATGARVLVRPDDAAFVSAKGVGVDGPLVHGDGVGPFRIVDAS